MASESTFLRELKILALERAVWSVSLYLPTHRESPDFRQDALLLRNLADEAEKRLGAVGGQEQAAQGLLAPVRAVEKDRDFWSGRRDGLAVLLSAGEMHTYRADVPFPGLAVVAGRYHLTPLLFWLLRGSCHVLCLSRGGARLYHLGPEPMEEIDVPAMPGGLAAVSGFEDSEKSLQHHSGSSAAGGERPAAVFHGHGLGDKQREEILADYLRLVDRAVAGRMEDKNGPLVLAAAADLQGAYRQVCTCGGLLTEGIRRNPADMGEEDLKSETLAILRARRERQADAAVERFHELAAAGRGTTDTEHILAAAAAGRVETILVADGAHRWERFDAGSGRTRPAPGGVSPDGDILDLAAVNTWLAGGGLHALPQGDVPGGGPAAATLRY